MKKIFTFSNSMIFVLMTFLTSYSTLAGSTNPQPIPEPSMLPLFALAGVVLYIIKRRKK
ncbi:MAG: PEP-CTERM sorting domain-containing protein [Thalassotalea sp.]